MKINYWFNLKVFFNDELLLKEAEIVGFMVAASPERLQIVDFTTPILTDRYCMIQSVPGIKNSFFAPVQPFQPLVS